MKNQFDIETVNHFVLHKHHLSHDIEKNDIVTITSDITGLHATGIKEPYIALFARKPDFSKEQLDHELYQKRTLGKIRCMRGTLYILTEEQIPIAYGATRSMFEKLSDRYAQLLGISEKIYIELSPKIITLLKGRVLTVPQIKTELNNQLNLSALINLMCDRGLLLRIQSGNGWQSKSYKYVPFAEFFPDINLAQYQELDATNLLIAGYLKSFGPATETDISWWTGLGLTRIRAALKNLHDRLAKISINETGDDFLILKSDIEPMRQYKPTGKHIINLLPILDPYLMGYKLRERYLNPKIFEMIFDRGGNATSTILVNGKIAGIWDITKEPETQLKIFMFDDINQDIYRQVLLEAQKTGRFIAGKEVAIKKVSTMIPLAQRTAGAFMSPLRDSV